MCLFQLISNTLALLWLQKIDAFRFSSGNYVFFPFLAWFFSPSSDTSSIFSLYCLSSFYFFLFQVYNNYKKVSQLYVHFHHHVLLSFSLDFIFKYNCYLSSFLFLLLLYFQELSSQFFSSFFFIILSKITVSVTNLLTYNVEHVCKLYHFKIIMLTPSPLAFVY